MWCLAAAGQGARCHGWHRLPPVRSGAAGGGEAPRGSCACRQAASRAGLRGAVRGQVGFQAAGGSVPRTWHGRCNVPYAVGGAMQFPASGVWQASRSVCRQQLVGRPCQACRRGGGSLEPCMTRRHVSSRRACAGRCSCRCVSVGPVRGPLCSQSLRGIRVASAGLSAGVSAGSLSGPVQGGPRQCPGLRSALRPFPLRDEVTRGGAGLPF